MNKNSRQLRVAARKIKRAGADNMEYQTPVGDYHNNPKFVKKILHLCSRDRDGVVSASPNRNMQMRVLQNKNEDSKTSSFTVHEPINKDRFVTHPNHEYMTYRQPAGAK
jgi:hypothetical protein